jgi:preprotein translocase subunit SecB
MTTDDPQNPAGAAPGGAPGGGEPAGGAAGGQRQALPAFQITAQYVKDLSFENPKAPQSLAPGMPSPQVQVNVDVRTNQLAERSYEVVLNVKADAKQNDEQAFLVELSYAGVVTLGENVQREHTAPLLLIEVPRMMFPFARAVIAEASRNGGFPPLLIQPIDFADLFRRQLEGLRARAQAAQQQGGGQTAPAEGGPAPSGPTNGGTA